MTPTKWSWTIEREHNRTDEKKNEGFLQVEQLHPYTSGTMSVCVLLCAGGSVVKLQEIRKLSPDQRLREKRAESCEPQRSVHQQGRRGMLHWAKPGALTEVFYFHVSVLRIRLRQIWYDQTGQTFQHALGSNRDRSKHHSLDQTFNYTDQTQTCKSSHRWLFFYCTYKMNTEKESQHGLSWIVNQM